MNYDLCPKYSDLFRGDNGENPEARKELIFAIDYDEISMNGWGGTIFLAQSCFTVGDDRDANGNQQYSLGVADGWAGIRMPSEYVFDYFGVTVPEDGYDDEGKYTGVYNYTDDRASMFYIKGHKEQMTNLAEFTRYRQRQGRHRLSDDPPGRGLPQLCGGLRHGRPGRQGPAVPQQGP